MLDVYSQYEKSSNGLNKTWKYGASTGSTSGFYTAHAASTRRISGFDILLRIRPVLPVVLCWRILPVVAVVSAVSTAHHAATILVIMLPPFTVISAGIVYRGFTATVHWQLSVQSDILYAEYPGNLK